MQTQLTQEQNIRKSKKRSMPSLSVSGSDTASSKKSKHSPSIRPIKPTARELFGTDSEDEAENVVNSQSASGKKAPLISSMTRRLANGISRQTHPNKLGTHFVEVKVYKVAEIENTSPMNRWRQAILSVKIQTNDNTEAWQHLTKYIAATRKEFKDIPPTFISNYF